MSGQLFGLQTLVAPSFAYIIYSTDSQLPLNSYTQVECSLRLQPIKINQVPYRSSLQPRHIARIEKVHRLVVEPYNNRILQHLWKRTAATPKIIELPYSLAVLQMPARASMHHRQSQRPAPSPIGQRPCSGRLSELGMGLLVPGRPYRGGAAITAVGQVQERPVGLAADAGDQLDLELEGLLLGQAIPNDRGRQFAPGLLDQPRQDLVT